MTHGGARNRAGRVPDPTSGRSDRRGYSLKALPAAGYDGPVPDFPLPQVTPRELEVWERAWRTPQACAWSTPSESWRVHTIAMWVRTFVRCEAPDATAALFVHLHRFADQIGMTTAGLAEMGWAVAEEPSPETAAEPRPLSSRARLRAVETRRAEDGGVPWLTVPSSSV